MNYKSNSEKNLGDLCLKIFLLVLFAHLGQMAYAQEGTEILAAETNLSMESTDTVLSSPEIVSERNTPKEIILDSNPSDGIINLALYEVPNRFKTIKILSLTGKTLESISLPEERNAFLKLDVSMFRNGTYYMKIANKDEVFAKSKFVLKK